MSAQSAEGDFAISTLGSTDVLFREQKPRFLLACGAPSVDAIAQSAEGDFAPIKLVR
jgi:hypothetical protein